MTGSALLLNVIINIHVCIYCKLIHSVTFYHFRKGAAEEDPHPGQGSGDSQGVLCPHSEPEHQS